jgi:hypothetical protein
MTKIDIVAGRVTPRILLDPDSRLYIVEGQSWPENARTFYRPVIDWFQEYTAASKVGLTLKIKLLYLNTSSISLFMYIFLLMEAAAKQCPDYKVEWYYDQENELAKEIGEEYQETLGLDFALIELPPGVA